MRRTKMLLRGLAAASALAVLPFTTTSTAPVGVNDACAQSGASCCPYAGATCFYQGECSGWGPWKKCPDPIEKTNSYYAGSGGCEIKPE